MLDEGVETRPAGVPPAADVTYDVAGEAGGRDGDDVELIAVAGELEDDSPFDYLGEIVGHGDGGGGSEGTIWIETDSFMIEDRDDAQIY